MKASLGLKNDENHRGFHLYLEILAQMFHAYHCQHDNGLPDPTNFYRPKFWFVLSGASSPDSAFLSFPLIPALYVKKTSSLRQATNLPFVLVPLKLPLVSGSQPCNFNCKYSVNNERF